MPLINKIHTKSQHLYINFGGLWCYHKKQVHSTNNLIPCYWTNLISWCCTSWFKQCLKSWYSDVGSSSRCVVQSVNLNWDTSCTNLCFPLFSSLNPGKFWDSTSNYATTSSIHTLPIDFSLMSYNSISCILSYDTTK